MKTARGDEDLRAAITQAKAKLTGDVVPEDAIAGWTIALREGWLQAVTAIERFLEGDTDEQGFSIVRSLDSDGLLWNHGRTTDSPLTGLLLKLAQALRDHGITRYN